MTPSRSARGPAQAGAQKTDTLIVLNTEAAVDAFTSRGQLKLGTDASVAAGPLGRSAQVEARVGDRGMMACFSYSHSRGIFGGLSLEGAVLSVRADDNAAFYGRKGVTVEEILGGRVPPPPAAAPLYALLNRLCVAPHLLQCGPRGAHGGRHPLQHHRRAQPWPTRMHPPRTGLTGTSSPGGPSCHSPRRPS